MRTEIFSLLLASILVLAVSPCTRAQGVRGNWQALESLAPGAEVIVETKSGETVACYVSRVLDNALDLTRMNGNGALSLGRDEIRRVYLAKRGSKSRAAKIGALIGGGAGLIAAVAVAAKLGKNSDPAPGVILFPVFGAGAGALVGAATGGKIRKGQLIYESN